MPSEKVPRQAITKVPVHLQTGAEYECRAEGCGLFLTNETAFGKHRLSQPSDTYELIRNVGTRRVAENNPSGRYTMAQVDLEAM